VRSFCGPLPDSFVQQFRIIATGKKITEIAEGTAKDVDAAVEAAQKAYDTVWGLNTPGFQRGKLLIRWAELIEEHADELAAIESLDNGKQISRILE